MPWDADHFPRSMLHLPTIVRDKAVEIANALLAEGYAEAPGYARYRMESAANGDDLRVISPAGVR